MSSRLTVWGSKQLAMSRDRMMLSVSLVGCRSSFKKAAHNWGAMDVGSSALSKPHLLACSGRPPRKKLGEPQRLREATGTNS